MNEHNEEIEILNKALEIVSRCLKKEEEYYFHAEIVVDAIISIDQEGCILFCNCAARKMFLYGDEIIGKNIISLMPERYRQRYKNGILTYKKTHVPMVIGKTIEMIGLKKNGTEFPIEISVSESDKDMRCYFVGIIRDITEKKRSERALLDNCNRLKELSVRDSLTNLYNRSYAFQVLEVELNRAKRYQKSLSCLMIDIDYFKKINDFYGHPFGDKVLVCFSSLLQDMVRSTDIVSRYGGEEFLVVLPEINIHGAMDFAERLRAAISQCKIENKEKHLNVTISISIGVSSFQEENDSKEEIISQADKALYEAKKTGRNRVCCYKQLSKQLYERV